MNVDHHLLLAGQNLLGSLSSDDSYLPYWHMVVDERRNARYEFRPYCTGHNVGRWWNALLRLENSTNFEIPDHIENAMLENSWRLANNKSGIFLEDVNPREPATWYIHSYRETMLALGLLVSHRGSEQARKCGLRAVSGMGNASNNLMEWRFSFAGAPSLGKQGNTAAPAYSHGRAIEGLLCFYEASGEQIALDEAERLSDFHFDYLVNEDGSLSSNCGHHTHSYLNTIRGLLLIAKLQNHQEHLEILYRTYQNAVKSMITHSGFVTHDIGDRYGGDIASAGDIAHIALILWDRYGDAQLLDDAERIVRARLIPAQVCDPVPLQPMIDWSGDSVQDLASRFVGTIGGSVGHVTGQTCVTDFTAAALHSLLELYDRSVDISDKTVRVNFHFDRQLPNLSISCVRNDCTATISVTNNTGKQLQLRLPNWTNSAKSTLRVDGQPSTIDIENGYVIVSQRDSESHTELSFELPSYEIVEQTRDESVDEEMVTFGWRGDEIFQVDNGKSYLEPHPSLCKSVL